MRPNKRSTPGVRCPVALAEIYANAFTYPRGRACRRYWVAPGILVGGNINDPDDWRHLREALGITAVINLDHRSESWIGIRHLLEHGVEDDGKGFTREDFEKVVSFARERLEEGPIYVHCHIGVSRSPTFAYAILRAVKGMPPAEALAAIDGAESEWESGWSSVPKHRTYVTSVESALADPST